MKHKWSGLSRDSRLIRGKMSDLRILDHPNVELVDIAATDIYIDKDRVLEHAQKRHGVDGEVAFNYFMDNLSDVVWFANRNGFIGVAKDDIEVSRRMPEWMTHALHLRSIGGTERWEIEEYIHNGYRFQEKEYGIVHSILNDLIEWETGVIGNEEYDTIGMFTTRPIVVLEKESGEKVMKTCYLSYWGYLGQEKLLDLR